MLGITEHYNLQGKKKKKERKREEKGTLISPRAAHCQWHEKHYNKIKYEYLS